MGIPTYTIASMFRALPSSILRGSDLQRSVMLEEHPMHAPTSIRIDQAVSCAALVMASVSPLISSCGSATAPLTIKPPAELEGGVEADAGVPVETDAEASVLPDADTSDTPAHDGAIIETGPGSPSVGFHMKGRFLYDKCGKKVLLRGINEMIVWSAGSDGIPEFAEIAKTGANAVRIVWNISEGKPKGLETAIANALDAKLIPIPELHDAMGKMDVLPALVDHWTSKEMLDVLSKYQDRILVNVGNEVGDDKVAGVTWEKAWIEAVVRMRRANITAPLIIDAPKWGQDIDRLQASGPKVLASDPLGNLMFSVHMWWTDGTAAKIESELQQSVSMNLPLLVGEFGPYAVYECPKYPFDYGALMAQAQAKEIGWLAWSWGAVKNKDCPGLFDMTKTGTFATLEGWGLAVAVSDPNSIQKTSRRPAFITTGSCQ